MLLTEEDHKNEDIGEEEEGTTTMIKQ